jgi:hypothetical protein
MSRGKERGGKISSSCLFVRSAVFGKGDEGGEAVGMIAFWRPRQQHAADPATGGVKIPFLHDLAAANWLESSGEATAWGGARRWRHGGSKMVEMMREEKGAGDTCELFGDTPGKGQQKIRP